MKLQFHINVFSILFCFMLLPIMVSVIHAQDCYDYSNAPQINELDAGPLADMAFFATSGDLIFACGADGDFIVVDYSNPEMPSLLGLLALGVTVKHIILSDDIVWIATADNGIAGIDISDPSEPQYLVNCPTGGIVKDLALMPGILIAAGNEVGLQVLDITIPASVTIVDTLAGDFTQVETMDQWVFGASLRGHVTVFNEIGQEWHEESCLDLNNDSPKRIMPIPVYIHAMEGRLYSAEYDERNPGGMFESSDGYCLVHEYRVNEDGSLTYTYFVRYPFTHGFQHMTICGDNGVLAVSSENRIDLRSVPGLAPLSTLKTETSIGSYNWIKLCDNGRLVNIDDGTTRLFDISNVTTSPIRQIDYSISRPFVASDNAFYTGRAFISDDGCYCAGSLNCYSVVDGKIDSRLWHKSYPNQWEMFDFEANGVLVGISFTDYQIKVCADDTTGTEYGSFGGGKMFSLYGSQVFGIGQSDSLHIHNLSDPQTPISEVHWVPNFNPSQMVAGDGLLYSTDGTDYLKVLDVSTGSEPTELPGLNLPAPCVDINISDNFCYALLRPGTSDELAVLSLDDPAAPVLVGSLALPAACEEFDVADGIVYLTSGRSALFVVDATDASSPTLEGTFNTRVPALAATSGAIFTRGLYGLNVLEPSCSAADPTPAMLSSFSIEAAAEHVEIEWNTSFFVDPMSFRLLAQSNGTTWEVSFTNVGTNYRAFDRSAMSFSPDEVLYSLQIKEDNVWYTIDQELLTLDIPVARMYLADPYPNPFNPSVTLSFTLAKPGHAKFAVYDLAGRLVKTLVDEECGVVGRQVVWSGVDDGGRVVGAGSYFARLEVGEVSSAVKVVLVK